MALHRPDADDAPLPHSPAAERNAGPILDVLRAVLPAAGRVLEIGSGTGQHAVGFAQALPGLRWQPSDPSPEARDAIARRAAAAGLPNLAPPLALDARLRPWPPSAVDALDAVVAINVIHISPWETAQAIVAESGRWLRPGGALLLYGPFRRGGAHTASSNAAFDADLRARDPSWGVRDLEAVEALAREAGFGPAEAVPMPANNFTVAFRRQD